LAGILNPDKKGIGSVPSNTSASFSPAQGGGIASLKIVLCFGKDQFPEKV